MMEKISIDLDELVRKMKVHQMRQIVSELEQDRELVRALWIEAFKQSRGSTQELTNAEQNANRDAKLFMEMLRTLDNGEELIQEFIGCTSSMDDERLAFASQMFIKGLAYGALYLEDVMKSRKQTQPA